MITLAWYDLVAVLVLAFALGGAIATGLALRDIGRAQRTPFDR